MTKKFDKFINSIKKWASSNGDIKAIAIVGSWARNSAKATSDIDLIIIIENIEKYLNNHDWLNNFGTVINIKDENWGLVKVKRVFYKNSYEVEYGLTTDKWIKLNPINEGAKRVVAGGFKILIDKNNLLANLLK